MVDNIDPADILEFIEALLGVSLKFKK